MRLITAFTAAPRVAANVLELAPEHYRPQNRQRNNGVGVRGGIIPRFVPVAHCCPPPRSLSKRSEYATTTARNCAAIRLTNASSPKKSSMVSIRRIRRPPTRRRAPKPASNFAVFRRKFSVNVHTLKSWTSASSTARLHHGFHRRLGAELRANSQRVWERLVHLLAVGENSHSHGLPTGAMVTFMMRGGPRR